jgi:hypothetical protein
MLLVSLFYTVVGIALAFILVLGGFRLFHVGVLAVLNLILAYGLFKMRKWSVKLLAVIFLPQIVFGVVTLYHSVTMWMFFSNWEHAAFNLSLIVFVVLCFISLAYVAAKSKEFK